MKNLILTLLYITAAFFTTAQNNSSKIQAAVKSSATELKQVMILQMPKTKEDDYPGKRGASVVWHPKQKKYYAAMAGNVLFPLAVFDMKGNRLSADTISCGADTRGLWYDEKENRICGNAYSDKGWFYYKLNENGIPYAAEIIYSGQNQPTEQSVGAFDFKQKKILFMDGSIIYAYDPVTAEVSTETIQIHWGRSKTNGAAGEEPSGETNEGYNYTTIVYTGLPGAEIGVLNYEKKQVELYDIKNGFLTKTLKLPDTIVTYDSFNFAFTNGIYWFFDQDTRKWTGYK